MEFSKVIESRRAIRAYKSIPVEEEKLQKLYKALQLAPSGNNRQPYKFIFVKDAEKRKLIAEKACSQGFVGQAPVLMVACCEKDEIFSAAIAIDHMILAATDEGLGTCWVAWFDKDVIREILDIPSDFDIPIIVPIGYPDEKPDARPRKPISEIVKVI